MSPTPGDSEKFLEKLTGIIESRLKEEQFGVTELAEEMGMSRSNLHRRVKAFTGKSVSRFISDIRLDNAVILLNESSKNISEIAFESGFNSPAYFTRCFKERYGHPPGEARNQVPGEEHHVEVNPVAEYPGQKNSGAELPGKQHLGALHSGTVHSGKEHRGKEHLGKQHSGADHKGDPAKKNGWRRIGRRKISVTYLLLTLLLFLTATFTFKYWNPFNLRKEPKEKSIAVLPFINDSPDEKEMYFINGTMESILYNLGKIEDIRVVSRTSVEQYRDQPKPIPLVAREMGVNYILEGSGHRDGERVRLYVQLLDGRRDRHLWARSYDMNVGEVFTKVSEIARMVASEINAVITPEEQALIEKIPTKSQTAFDLAMKAREEHRKDPSKGEELIRLALEFDSAYAQAYVFLGWLYFHQFETATMARPEYLDSILCLVNRALYHDPQLDDAYLLRGYYHRRTGAYDQSVADFRKTTELNPNFPGAYIGLAWLGWEKNDMLTAIQNFHRSIELEKGPEMAHLYRNLAAAYFQAGLRDQSDRYYLKALEMDGDSVAYYLAMSVNEDIFNHHSALALDYLERVYRADPDNTNLLYRLGNYYACIGENEKSLRYFNEYLDQFTKIREVPVTGKLAASLTYMRCGLQEIADSLLNAERDQMENRLALGDQVTSFYYTLARIYALQGNREKAYQYLRRFNQCEFMVIYNTTLKPGATPMIPELADDEAYWVIQEEINDKYLNQQIKIRQWLAENELL